MHLHQISQQIKVTKNQANEWTTGFGWDERHLPFKKIWSLSEIDQQFDKNPIYFSRVDGHAGITNSLGKELLAQKGIHSDHGNIFFELDHYAALNSLPQPTLAEIREALIQACRYFNSNGYTHVRDMESTEAAFLEAIKLEKEGLLTLRVDWNFLCEKAQDIEGVIAAMKRSKSLSSKLNHVAGLKIYMDGSLGSRTAWLSQPYADNGQQSKGIWSIGHLDEVMEKVWTEGFPLAVHAIGDAAADFIVERARALSARGIAGHLHLEHVEVLRDETIQKMKPLHVRCHVQPCHLLSDQEWLRERLGTLYRFAFPWEAIRKAKIPMSFGHDSPIEEADVFSTLKAIELGKALGIAELRADPWEFMSHPTDTDVFGETVFENEKVLSVHFLGKKVFSAPS